MAQHRAKYSASAVDKAIADYFFAHQVTGPVRTLKIKPAIEEPSS
jgi:hypothetical protein